MNHPKNKLLLIMLVVSCGFVTTSLAESDDREKPIKIEADRVTVDDINQTSTFEGNVQAHQGTLLIEAAKIIVTQDKKGFSQMTATGQLAHLRQKRDGVSEYTEGFGERFEYDSFADIVNIFGQARIKREGDDVRGEHIIYNTKTGVFQVFGANEKNSDTPNKGRVTIVIQPKEQAGDHTPGTQPQPITPSTPHTQLKQ